MGPGNGAVPVGAEVPVVLIPALLGERPPKIDERVLEVKEVRRGRDSVGTSVGPMLSLDMMAMNSLLKLWLVVVGSDDE